MLAQPNDNSNNAAISKVIFTREEILKIKNEALSSQNVEAARNKKNGRMMSKATRTGAIFMSEFLRAYPNKN